MNRKQLNTTGMAGVVSAYMDDNKTTWNGVKAIADTMDDLNAEIEAVGEKAGAQETPIGGATDQKVQVRNDFEEEIFLISSQLSALAAKKKDMNLSAQVEFSLPMLDKMDDDGLEELGKRISGLATANLAALADYKITAADVTILDNLTTQFHELKTAPRTAIAGRAGQTRTMPTALKNVTSILRNRLDKQMVMFKKTEPEFYQGYLSARVILDRGNAQHPVSPAPVSPTPPTPPPQ